MTEDGHIIKHDGGYGGFIADNGVHIDESGTARGLVTDGHYDKWKHASDDDRSSSLSSSSSSEDYSGSYYESNDFDYLPKPSRRIRTVYDTDFSVKNIEKKKGSRVRYKWAAVKVSPQGCVPPSAESLPKDEIFLAGSPNGDCKKKKKATFVKNENGHLFGLVCQGDKLFPYLKIDEEVVTERELVGEIKIDKKKSIELSEMRSIASGEKDVWFQPSQALTMDNLKLLKKGLKSEFITNLVAPLEGKVLFNASGRGFEALQKTHDC